MNMKTKDINNLIKELNTTIDWWVENRQLFAGGCCWSAYLLARGFERLGIRYSTVVYQCGDNWNTNKFSKVTNGDGCGHIAICVVYKHKKMVIGFNEYFDYSLKKCMGYCGDWMIRNYTGISAKNLLRTYHSNCWNEIWYTGYNSVLSREINAIFNKYAI